MAQIISERRSVLGVGEKTATMACHALTLLRTGQDILHPMKCPDDTYGRALGPIKAAWRGGLEVNFLGAELDRP